MIINTTTDAKIYIKVMEKDIINNPAVIGNNLKKLRTIHELTLDDISFKAGLSKSFISQIENGSRRISPSDIRNMLKIYNYTLSRFLTEIYSENLETEKNKIFTKDNTGILIEGSRQLDKYHLLLLNPVFDSDNNQILELYLPPSSEYSKNFISLDATIKGVILSGNLLIQLQHDEFQVSEGDNFKFYAKEPHIFRNFKNTPMKAILFVSPPVF